MTEEELDEIENNLVMNDRMRPYEAIFFLRKKIADMDALLNNAAELLSMKPESEWTVPERAFLRAVPHI